MNLELHKGFWITNMLCFAMMEHMKIDVTTVFSLIMHISIYYHTITSSVWLPMIIW